MQGSDLALNFMNPLAIPARFKTVTREDYFGSPKALNEVTKYIKAHQKAFVNGVNLYLHGNSNSGKTFLACFALIQLENAGYKVGYTTLSELTSLMMQPIDGHGFSSVLRQTEYLVLDAADEGLNEGSRLALSRTIAFRRDEALPTILCSVHYDDATDPAGFYTASLGDVFQRFLDLAHIVHCAADPFKVSAHLTKLKRL